MVVAATATGLRAAGHEVTVVSTDQLMSADERARMSKQQLLFRSLGGRRIAFSPRMVWWLVRRVRDFDVVHVHGYQQPVSLATIAICVLLRRPFVLAPHGTLGPYELAKGRRVKSTLVVLLRLLLAVAPRHRILCTTEAEERELPTWVDPTVVSVSPIPVAPEQLPSARSDGGAPARPFVLHLGRVAAKKGLGRTSQLLAASSPELDLVVAGDVSTPAAERIRTEVRYLLGDRARFVGHVDGAEKAALLRAASCLALLSDDENFAVAVAEALVVGTPVLVSERVGLAPTVRRLGGGVVVAGDGSGASPADLERVLNHGHRRRLAEAARAAFHPDAVARGIEAVYRELVDGGR